MLRKLALAVSWRGGDAARVRSVVLLLAAALVTVVAGVATSAALMSSRVNERAAARVFQPASETETVDLSRATLYDSFRGEQLFIYFWRIETDGVVIPGLPADPPIGTWFVSPELNRRIDSAPELETRFPDAVEIAPAGIGAGDELLAYRIVGEEMELNERLVNRPGSDWIGLNAPVSGLIVGLAGAGLILVLGVGFLRAALGPIGVGLERRLALLEAMGATRSSLRKLTALTTAFAVIPGVGLGALFWYLLAPKLESVPIVGEVTLRGDLSLPSWLMVGIAASVVGLSLVLSVRVSRAHTGSRPTSRIPRSTRWWRLLPLLASTSLIFYAKSATGDTAGLRLVSGLLAAALTITFALPVLINLLGRIIASGSSMNRLLIGRRLSWNATTSSLALMALASMAVLVPTAGSHVAAGSEEESPSPPPAAVETTTIWGPFDTETIAALEAQSGGVFVEIYSEEVAPNLAPLQTWVGDCEKLRKVVELSQCGSEGIVVGSAAEPDFAHLDAGALSPPEGSTFDSYFLVAPIGSSAENVVRDYVANADQAGFAVASPADRVVKNSRNTRWIIGGIKLAVTGAFVALLMSVITNASQAAGTRVRLVGIGAGHSLLRRLAGVESMILVAVAGLTGTAIGTIGAILYAAIEGTVSTNYVPSLAVAGATLVAAGVAGMAGAVQVSISVAESTRRARD